MSHMCSIKSELTFVEKEYASHRFLHELLYIRSCLTNVLSDQIGGRTFLYLRLTEEPYVVEDLTYLLRCGHLAGSCNNISNVGIGRRSVSQFHAKIFTVLFPKLLATQKTVYLPGGPLKRKLNGSCSRESMPSAFVLAAVV
jgi:hypothetical protein